MLSFDVLKHVNKACDARASESPLQGYTLHRRVVGLVVHAV